MNYLPPVVEQHNEAVQNVERHSGYDEEINGSCGSGKLGCGGG
jgi:hypothetical protein